MRSHWDVRISRAQELSGKHPEAAELLDLYAKLAAFQKTVFHDMVKCQASDPTAVSRHFPKLREILDRHGPKPAVDYAREYLGSTGALDGFLSEHWDDPSIADVFARFYARILLQPFAEALLSRGVPPSSAITGICPFCGARAMAAVLRGEGDGAKRFLLCSLCALEWEFVRIRCPGCGCTDKDKLPVFTTPDFDYIRIEACDECKVYVKAIDLTKNGLAVPVADELASVSLNVWAEEHGYSKYEPNLLGL